MPASVKKITEAVGPNLCKHISICTRMPDMVCIIMGVDASF